ncbi:hypothetical protein DTO271D3_9028 [Paecilomyces variotii]|nr:hypothetical protein DTO032I3_1701 [Paecilomyces variotii]KAJ9261814.1 hypothetical protein DTO212C5_8142 [Paecilomyces variotii]KAJ9278148.1 hypothetical protein DTO021D3_4882 [Paecilomyces variotii]KAJ9310711.1 hypothetical protein DTO271D3_9028 [Paecilomyces variotii]KAJ9345512.1 hypothetical protein DTO027B6_2043 [Paecilomyces variotii]
MQPTASMFPTHSGEIRHDSRTENQSSNSRPNPHQSVDDYNRVMLQYTQRQMASFTKSADPSRRNDSVGSGSSGSSGRSSSSHNSNRSNNSVLSSLDREPSGAGPPRGGRERHQNDAEGVPPQ